MWRIECTRNASSWWRSVKQYYWACLYSSKLASATLVSIFINLFAFHLLKCNLVYKPVVVAPSVPFANSMHIVSALSVTVQVEATTAIVTFRYPHPDRVARYEASLNGHSERKCSVVGSAQPLRCTVNGIPEADRFYINADVCLKGSQFCQYSIAGPFQSKMRSRHYYGDRKKF